MKHVHSAHYHDPIRCDAHHMLITIRGHHSRQTCGREAAGVDDEHLVSHRAGVTRDSLICVQRLPATHIATQYNPTSFAAEFVHAARKDNPPAKCGTNHLRGGLRQVAGRIWRNDDRISRIRRHAPDEHVDLVRPEI